MLTITESVMESIRTLPPNERLHLANLILQELTQSGIQIVEQSGSWSEQDQNDLTAFSLQYAAQLYPEDEDIV